LRRKAQVSAIGQTHVLRAVPVTSPSDDRSPAAKAYQWASRIMIVSLEMVLPGIAGYWIDKKLGTLVLFMLMGFALGCTAAVIHLVRMTRTDQSQSRH
jgi:hypothetical protein